jgi:hypothetical protein
MDMKRSITLLLVLGLIVGSLVGTAEAKKKKKKVKAPVRVERKVEINYSGPNIGVSSPAATGGVCQLSTDEPGACIETPTGAEDLYVKIVVTDASGQKVAGSISQGDTDGDGVSNIYGQFCGETPAALPLAAPGVPLRVTAYSGTCADGSTPSVMTTGIITVTFSNLP